MKSLVLMSGKEKLISDEEANNIKKIIEKTKFIELRDGSLINTSSIVSIDEVAKKDKSFAVTDLY